MQQLLREIRELGYPGSSNLLVRYLNQGRANAERPHQAPRKATRILLTRPGNRTDGQRETAVRLASACPEMKALASLIGSFAAMLRPDPANEEKLQQWMPTRGPPTCRTCTASRAASTSISRPPPPRSRSRTTTGERKASTSVWLVRRRGPVRGRPCKADGSAHRSRAPIPVRYTSVDAEHGGVQRDKVTHAGTEKKRPASARIRS